MTPTLPARPPFTLRARLLTPLDGGGSRFEPDAALVVDAGGRIAFAGPFAARPAPTADAPAESVVDLRPLVLLPGMVDLHVHLPQVPSAGLGAGLDLLTWLERHIFPLERHYDVATASALAPAVFRAMAAAGTTTVVGYGAIWQDSLDATFAAAEAHGIRAVIGKVMMDRITYNPDIAPSAILEQSLRESEELCQAWHGRDGGRLAYAFTPRFAVSCSAEMLAASAAAAARHGAYWQTHLSEDAGEIARVRELFPDAIDYLDVYDRAGGVTSKAILAHAIHLSDREIDRLAAARSAIAHCPASNLFLASGVMPLARYRAAGLHVGLGSDVAAAPELSIVTQMRTGFYAAHALAIAGRAGDGPLPGPLDWIRLGSLEGARALGIDDRIGSLEAGKEADLIAVDPRLTLPPGGVDADDADAIASRLIFREQPGMVRGAWVRGRLLPADAPGAAVPGSAGVPA
ncbi:MAG: amidohydrolase family protein [Chloroflexota bacterium]